VSGEYIWIDARGIGLFDGDGHLKRFVGSINDISERKARERELEIANKEALKAAAAKASFLSTMSHEIRTPLNGVIGATSLLETTHLDPEQKRFVDTIHSSSEALLSVVTEVLDFSKIDSDRMTLDLAPVILVELLEQVIDIVADKARSKRIEIFYELDPLLPTVVELDPVRIRQILLNLLGNAIKFTHRGYVSLQVSLVHQGTDQPEINSKDRLLFAVADTGIGISHEHLESIFEPFAQADSSTTRRFGGTGLGLAIVRKLCTVMGGSINVASEMGKGSTFSATIPLRTVDKSAEPEGVQRFAFESRSTPNNTQNRIALCVPHAGLSQSLNRMLTSWGLGVETFESVDALSNAAGASHQWSAIVMDLDQAPERVLSCFNRIPLAFVIGISQTTSTQLQSIYPGVIGKLSAQLLRPVRQSQLYNALLQTTHLLEAPESDLIRANGHVTERPLTTRNVSSRPDVGAGVTQNDSQSSLHNLPVLIAEDNIVNQIIIREMARRANLKPTVVGDGKAALKHAMSGQYPVVILDINMPELSGLDVARELVAQLPKHQRPYIIALTAHALTGDRETCLAAGMDDYLSKPLQAKSLHEALVRLEPALKSRHAWQRFLQPYANGLIGEVLDVTQLEEISGATASNNTSISTSTREFVTTLITNFERRGNEIIAQLNVLVPAYEVHKAQQLTHSLVGSALNIGAKALGEHLRRLEQALRQRESEQASQLVVSVRPLFDQALDALRHWTNVYAKPPENAEEQVISPKSDL
jgi:signal transduction histidine kinase/CheY-like chemotaxis protein